MFNLKEVVTQKCLNNDSLHFLKSRHIGYITAFSLATFVMGQTRHKLLIYGATGYTGRLACEQAQKVGLDFTVAGRTAYGLDKLAKELQVPYHAFEVNDAITAMHELPSCHTLLNCAGPFSRTAKPLMKACIRHHINYLDIAAELDSYELAETLDLDARQAEVMLLPGCGGSVAMLGCLARRTMEIAASPVQRLDIALHVAGAMSRGSVASATGGMTNAPLERRMGKLDAIEGIVPMEFDFLDGRGRVSCAPMTLPDLITASIVTGVENIRTFVNVSTVALPAEGPEEISDGPSQRDRDLNPYHAAAVMKSNDGSVAMKVLHTVNGYTFTVKASIEAALRVLEGTSQPGFQTPAALFGTGFVESVANSKFIDIVQ